MSSESKPIAHDVAAQYESLQLQSAQLKWWQKSILFALKKLEDAWHEVKLRFLDICPQLFELLSDSVILDGNVILCKILAKMNTSMTYYSNIIDAREVFSLSVKLPCALYMASSYQKGDIRTSGRDSPITSL